LCLTAAVLLRLAYTCRASSMAAHSNDEGLQSYSDSGAQTQEKH